MTQPMARGEIDGDIRYLPPPVECDLGLEIYATSTRGVPGVLKLDAGDFRVGEISAYPVPAVEGPFTILRLQSRDWEQHELAEAIARRLGLSRNALRWAGTKDRRAVSEKLVSYRGAPPPPDFAISQVTVLEAYRARDGLTLGHHYGNSFDICIRGIDPDDARMLGGLRATAAELIPLGGVPNFFGLQRFGEVRPITHRVGQLLVRGDVESAVDQYLTFVEDGSDEVGDRARESFAEHRDSKRALNEFPREYRFERAILERLAEGQSPTRALGVLSRDLRRLFVHAYQSRLFNRWLSRRWRAGLSFERPVIGDFVIRYAPDGTLRASTTALVESDNLAECSELTERGRALIAGPLLGFETPSLTGKGGQLFEDILREEGVSRDNFRLPRTPEIASPGSWRAIRLPTPPIGISAEGSPNAPAERTEASRSLHLKFALPKGAYATVVLREFLKTGAMLAPPPASRPR